MAAGARDVHYFPVFMKKNRPAYQLNVICSPQEAAKMEALIFANTTTIGIRRQFIERTILERQIKSIDTVWGKVRLKACTLPEGLRYYPEYEDVAAICRQQHLDYSYVYNVIMNEAVKAF